MKRGDIVVVHTAWNALKDNHILLCVFVQVELCFVFSGKLMTGEGESAADADETLQMKSSLFH